MSIGELLTILIVALLVFGPSKLPLVAHHLGKLISRLSFYKALVGNFWQQQWLEYQLQENQKKAKEADTQYHKTHENQDVF